MADPTEGPTNKELLEMIEGIYSSMGTVLAAISSLLVEKDILGAEELINKKITMTGSWDQYTAGIRDKGK
jgi:hypothetical protein